MPRTLDELAVLAKEWDQTHAPDLAHTVLDELEGFAAWEYDWLNSYFDKAYWVRLYEEYEPEPERLQARHEFLQTVRRMDNETDDRLGPDRPLLRSIMYAYFDSRVPVNPTVLKRLFGMFNRRRRDERTYRLLLSTYFGYTFEEPRTRDMAENEAGEEIPVWKPGIESSDDFDDMSDEAKRIHQANSDYVEKSIVDACGFQPPLICASVLRDHYSPQYFGYILFFKSNGDMPALAEAFHDRLDYVMGLSRSVFEHFHNVDACEPASPNEPAEQIAELKERMAEYFQSLVRSLEALIQYYDEHWNDWNGDTTQTSIVEAMKRVYLRSFEMMTLIVVNHRLFKGTNQIEEETNRLDSLLRKIFAYYISSKEKWDRNVDITSAILVRNDASEKIMTFLLPVMERFYNEFRENEQFSYLTLLYVLQQRLPKEVLQFILGKFDDILEKANSSLILNRQLLPEWGFEADIKADEFLAAITGKEILIRELEEKLAEANIAAFESNKKAAEATATLEQVGKQVVHLETEKKVLESDNTALRGFKEGIESYSDSSMRDLMPKVSLVRGELDRFQKEWDIQIRRHYAEKLRCKTVERLFKDLFKSLPSKLKPPERKNHDFGDTYGPVGSGRLALCDLGYLVQCNWNSFQHQFPPSITPNNVAQHFEELNRCRNILHHLENYDQKVLRATSNKAFRLILQFQMN